MKFTSVCLSGWFLLLSTSNTNTLAFQPQRVNVYHGDGSCRGGASSFSRRSLLSSSSSTTTTPTTAALSVLKMMNIDENASRDMGSFIEWGNMYGVQRAEGVQLNSDDGMDYNFITTQPLGAGAPVLSVPNNLILSSYQTSQEFAGFVDDAVNYLGRLGSNDQVPQFYLLVKILSEYEKAEQSPWYAWMNSLPRLFYNAVSMTSFCYECLPPLVFRLARQERLKFDNFYDALQKVDIISSQTKSNEQLVKWAYNVVTTRSTGTDTAKFIVPMADMFNHGTETEISINYDENGNCVVYTTKDVQANSPLRMSYGDPSNPSHLFATYGFLDETSPATFCKIMTIQPNQELLDIGYGFDKMLFYKDTGHISQEVWDVVLYQILNSNRAVQQQFYDAHMRGDAETKQWIHQQYFIQTASALQDHVDTFLDQLDVLGHRGDGMDVNEHPRLPLILKHNDFVRSTFLKVKANLDSQVAQATGGYQQEPVLTSSMAIV